MTDTQIGAFEAMLAHHRSLGDHVELRVDALSRAAAGGYGYETAAAELVAYLAEEVLPHATAEEQTIYRAAAARADLAGTVAEMIGEHRVLAETIEQLTEAPDALEAAHLGESIGALFASHVAKENDLLLPPLLIDEDVDLSELLVRMQRLTSTTHEETPLNGDVSALDHEAKVLRLLLEAATALARAGHGDHACKIVASAWTALREPRPELAVRTTAALHRLALLGDAEPVTFHWATGHDGHESGTELDVRELAPAQRHETIFATYHALGAGSSFVLVNDHDPKPLRYQFEAEHAGKFTWDTIEAGPKVWRVRIAKVPATAGDTFGAGTATREEEPQLDVRVLPHGQRHELIFTAYRALDAGAGFVLVNDHDPKPLHYQFEAEHSGEFTWDYLESGPELWRVRVGRTSGAPAR